MPQIGNPSRHKTTHQDGGTDELDLSGLAGQQIWVPYNAKIKDITETDTNKHYLNLKTTLSETRNIIGALLFYLRQSGSGVLALYPNEGTAFYIYPSNQTSIALILLKDQINLQYSQTVANDDFDLYCAGYIVEA